jgi:hypothetical protein
MKLNSAKITQEVRAELQSARDWRLGGNEGRARVCARRAAGMAIGLFYQVQTGEPASMNAYNLLRWFAAHASAGQMVKQAARRLTTRVTVDHNLPHSEDPLADAEIIIESLLSKSGG